MFFHQIIANIFKITDIKSLATNGEIVDLSIQSKVFFMLLTVNSF